MVTVELVRRSLNSARGKEMSVVNEVVYVNYFKAQQSERNGFEMNFGQTGSVLNSLFLARLCNIIIAYID